MNREENHLLVQLVSGEATKSPPWRDPAQGGTISNGIATSGSAGLAMTLNPWKKYF